MTHEACEDLFCKVFPVSSNHPELNTQHHPSQLDYQLEILSNTLTPSLDSTECMTITSSAVSCLPITGVLDLITDCQNLVILCSHWIVGRDLRDVWLSHYQEPALNVVTLSWWGLDWGAVFPRPGEMSNVKLKTESHHSQSTADWRKSISLTYV